MKHRELDEALKHKLNGASKVPDHIWARIQHELDTKTAPLPKGKFSFRKYFGLMAAAVTALILLSSAWTFYYFLNKEAKSLQTEQLASKNKIQKSTQPQPIAQQDLAQHDNVEKWANNSPTQNLPPISKKEFVAYTPENKIIISPIEKIENNSPIAGLKGSIYPEAKMGKQDLIVSLPEINFNSNEKLAFKDNHLGMQLRDEDQMTFDPVITSSKHNANKKMYYGVSGAYSYGSLDEGGAVAFNTRKNLNERFFIDGSVGLVVNNSSPLQGNFNGDFIAYKSNPQAINAKSKSNLFTNANTFYFVQVNPSVGINVSKNIDVSVGPDYQQMVSNSQYDVVMFEGSKLLPKHDFGLTGKAEIGITPNLKAGLLYREGVTPILANDNNIAARRYFQVQLKIQIPSEGKK